MDQILRQLGELLLGAIPTVLLLAVLYILYNSLVYRPLTAVLAERRNRTQGAMEKARADIAAAESRTADYEQRLREARQKIFKNQEARRQQATQVRSQAVNQARSRAQEQVKQARVGIDEDVQQAAAKLQSDAERLAVEIVRTVMRPCRLPVRWVDYESGHQEMLLDPRFCVRRLVRGGGRAPAFGAAADSTKLATE
jgi:F0F1-type ATP synthase, subunit b